jgi:vesicle coat complex subunit
MDIMDYIRPATCTDEVFRSMWAEFEWENKVAISTSITSLVEFLEHVVKSTNMRCLTPHDKSEKGSFLAANLYARRYVFHLMAFSATRESSQFVLDVASLLLSLVGVR